MEKLLENYFDRLWPICRSITGNGLRESLRIIQELVPLELTEVPTGTQVFDWEIPREWNIRDAYIITPDGEKICDFRSNNLHVVNYSTPQDREISFDELKEHLHFREDLPTAIPYVTSYYKENWGFCLSYDQFKKLPKAGTYKILIDSTLEPGHLTYGDLVLKGESEKEILFSTYLCHPSMANNELSGPLVQAFLYQKIKELPKRKYTYRFVFAPETIGIIAYLAAKGQQIKERTVAGLVLTCVGTAADIIYKKPIIENSLIDKAVMHTLKFGKLSHSVIPFAVGGSDERQYCSPGFNLPVGSIIRSMYQQYPEYHTSLDNKELISFKAMEGTIEACFNIVRAMEAEGLYRNTKPFCEPRLGKYGLYPDTGGTLKNDFTFTRMVLHTLAFSDGKNSLIDIAEKYGKPVYDFIAVTEPLIAAGLLKKNE